MRPTPAWLAAFVTLLMLAAVNPAAAQAPVQTVRVASGPAHVLLWRAVEEHRLATVPTGTMLDVVLVEGDWYWIMLPPDAHGTRRSGWIKAFLVEPVVMVVDPAQRPVFQTPAPPPEPPATLPRPRSTTPLGGFIQGLGGATFGDETSSTVGGLVAFTVAPNLQVTAEIGRMQNVMPKSLESSLVDAAQRTSTFFFLSSGQVLPVTLSASVPALYGIFGVRGWIPADLAVQPYVDLGFGFANVMPDFEMRLSGRDVTREVLDFGILADPEDEIEPLVGIGGGVLVPLVNGLAADIGYRYQRIFTGDGVNISRVTFGLAYRF
jgi:hypothetical protein